MKPVKNGLNNLKRNKMKSSIEWLIMQLPVSIRVELYEKNIYLQVKEMHKAEIIDAVDLPKEKRWYDAKLYNSSGEQYYQETFKKD